MNTNRRGSTPGKGGNDRKKTNSFDRPGKPFDKTRSENRDGEKPVRKATFIKGRNPKAAEPKPAVKAPLNKDEMRLNKYISNSGMCSRRDADIYIQSGNVKVNGQVITEMGYKVKITDTVEFDGTRINPEKKEYVLLNKPKNFVTTGEGDRGQRNVAELLRGASNAVLQPVGRMDVTTTGLLIFTNDTEMVRKFAQPNQKSFKIYQVSLDKNLKQEDFESIKGGVTLDGHRLYIDEISYIEGQPRTEIGLKLRTPNVKVVRAIFENFKYNVLKVDRVSFAGLTKKNLPRGNYRHLTEQEVINLKNV